MGMVPAHGGVRDFCVCVVHEEHGIVPAREVHKEQRCIVMVLSLCAFFLLFMKMY